MTEYAKVPNGSGLGNTIIRPAPSLKWVLTWNNYTDGSISSIVSHKDVDKYVIGEEVGESGTPHLQGWIKFKRKVRPMGLFAKEIHWEKAKGSDEQNYIYCSKDHKVTQNWKYIPLDPMRNKVFYEWQKEIIKIISEDPDERTVNWFWESVGAVGKTSMCKHLAIMYGALVVGGKANDVKYAISEYVQRENKGPQIVIWSLTRSHDLESKVSYEAIEAIKDGIFFNNKYESAQCLYNPPHIFIFANFLPAFERMSSDRWNVINIRNNGKFIRSSQDNFSSISKLPFGDYTKDPASWVIDNQL